MSKWIDRLIYGAALAVALWAAAAGAREPRVHSGQWPNGMWRLGLWEGDTRYHADGRVHRAGTLFGGTQLQYRRRQPARNLARWCRRSAIRLGRSRQ